MVASRMRCWLARRVTTNFNRLAFWSVKKCWTFQFGSVITDRVYQSNFPKNLSIWTAVEGSNKDSLTLQYSMIISLCRHPMWDRVTAVTSLVQHCFLPITL
jgi:hypothetical protein